MKTPFYFSLWLAELSLGFSLSPLQAQVIPDQTLGSENSVVVPDVIKGLPSDRIDGGAIRGSNLFQSFREFSVGEGRGAYFSNPEGITNIFSRVTGNNPSQILGTLGVLGNANLYFLNPNGIIFGPNAQLDVRGSFLATTADGFQFPNGYGFSASNPTAPPLLTVNIPIGLNFRANSTAIISNQGNLSTGQDLTLAAGNLDLQSQLQAGNNLTLEAQDTVKIRDSVTSPFIAAARGDLSIQGDKAVDIFALNHPDSGLFSLGNMTLRSAEQVGGDAHFWSGGNFRIELLDGSLGKLYSPHDPVIRTAGDVLIGSYVGASLHIIAGGKVEIPGYVWIYQSDPDYGLQEVTTLADGTVVNIDGKNQPTLDIRAGVDPSAISIPGIEESGFDFFSGLEFSNPPSSADINVGTIIFKDFNFNSITGHVLLTNQYYPNLNLIGDIQVQSTLTGLDLGAIEAGGLNSGGNVTISSRGNIILTGDLNSYSHPDFGDAGNGGEIILSATGSIETQSLNSYSWVDYGNAGNGGNITLKSGKDITVNGNLNSFSYAVDGNAKNAGNIALNAGSNIETQALDTSSSSNFGDAAYWGGITLIANGDITTKSFNSDLYVNYLDYNNVGRGNAISLDSKQGSISFDNDNVIWSNGGEINLNALKEISLASGSIIKNSIFGDGDSGNIIINANSLLLKNGSAIIADIVVRGNSGDIIIKAKNLTVGEQEDSSLSEISNSVVAIGNAGKIDIQVDQNLTLNAGSEIRSTLYEGASGRAGDIEIKANNLSSTRGLVISSTFGQGDAGNIQLNTGSLFLVDGAGIYADTDGQGDSGQISITATDRLSLSGKDSDGIASTIQNAVTSKATGKAGGITINTQQLLLDEGIISATTQGIGNAGNINLNVNSLTLQNGARIEASTSGSGDAGKVQITAQDILLTGEGSQGNTSGIGSEVLPKAKGNSGGISINTKNLSLQNGTLISTSTAGQGNAGTLAITAQNISLTGESSQGKGSGISSQVAVTATGNSDGITIDTGSLSLQDGARIDASTFGKGNAGIIKITAQDITLAGEDRSLASAIASRVEPESEGNSGGISITTNSLSLQGGTQIGASTFGKGNSGTLQINAQDITLAGRDKQSFPSGLSSAVDALAEGNSQGITINSANLQLQDGAYISARSAGIGNAGTITINSSEFIKTSGSFFWQADNRKLGGIEAFTNQTGTAGNVLISTQAFSISDGASVSAFTTGAGNAGSIIIYSPNLVDISANSSLTVETSSSGRAGDINLTTNVLNIGKNAQLSATATATATNSQGGGSITLNTQNLSVSGKLGIFAETQGQAPAGTLTLNPDNYNPDLNIRFTDDGFISARTTSSGKGGNINLSAPNLIDIRGQGKITAETSGSGNAGNIQFTSQQLNLADGVEVSATTTGTGNAGNILINTPQSLTIDNQSRLTAETQSAGKAGDITITTQTLNLGKDSELSTRATATSTNPEGGGSINLHTSNLNISGKLGIFAETQGQAPAGTLMINPNNNPDLNIRFTDDGFISALTSASGKGGNINLSASNLIDIRGQGKITTETSGTGNAGTISLNSRRLNLQDGVSVSASSTNLGQGGNLTITAPEAIRLQKAQLSTQATNTGEAGNINLQTAQLELTENSAITASSQSSQGGDLQLQNLETLTVHNSQITASTADGNAGSLTINANQNPVNNIQLNQGSLAVKATGIGNSGNLTVNARTVNLDNQSEISASTKSGIGGNINLPNLDTLQINNSEISAATTSGMAGSISINSQQNVALQNQGKITVEATEGGTAGDLTLQTDTLTLTDSRISVSSLTGQAGNITIQTKDLQLDQGAITAETGKTGVESGANINLNVSNFMTLRMANNSLISATAYGYADGGNVTINAPLLIAMPGTGSGNDIIAKAFFGDGGRININALGIFGVSEGKALVGNQSNDIDASSEYGAAGIVTLNQAIDPNRGLVALPSNVVDPSQLIERNVCQRRRQGQSQLTVTGKTDLPPSLEDDFSGSSPGVNLVEPSGGEVGQELPLESVSPQVPAQGWQRLANGQMMLVGEPVQGVMAQRYFSGSQSCLSQGDEVR